MNFRLREFILWESLNSRIQSFQPFEMFEMVFLNMKINSKNSHLERVRDLCYVNNYQVWLL